MCLTFFIEWNINVFFSQCNDYPYPSGFSLSFLPLKNLLNLRKYPDEA